MKQNLIAIFTLLITSSVFAQSSEITGFRDLVWGVHIDSVYSNGEKVKFKKDKDAEKPNAYYIVNDRLTLGAAKLTGITYYFTQDKRFKRVMLRGNDKYLKDVKDILRFKFRAPDKEANPSTNLKTLEWLEGDVSVLLTHRKNEELFTLSLESNWDKSKEMIANMNVKDIPYNGEVVAGFRHFRWLDKKDSIYHNGEKVQFMFDREASEPNTYYLENEKHSLGSARLSSVSYIFNEDDKLTKFVLTGPSEYYNDVKFILNNKFGGAKDVNNLGMDMSVTQWEIKDTIIKLSESGGGDTFTIIMETLRDQTESYMKNINVTDF